MGMDALTSAAFESLEQKILQQLQEQLTLLAAMGAGDRVPTPEMQSLLTEAKGLFQIMEEWSGISDTATSDQAPADADDAEAAAMLAAMEAEESSDDEAAAMLAEMEGEDLSDEGAMAELEAMNETAAPDAISEDMSDEEAMAALEAMDETAAPTAISEDMSDEAAMAALEAMDGPAEDTSANEVMNDADAMAALEAMDSVAMSDDDAAAALAAMDDSSEMDDDEAAAMLAAMDTTAEAATPVAAAPEEELSADDEAAAMLAALESGDDIDEPEAAPAAAASPSSDSQTGPIEEIPEWEENEFQNDPEMTTDFLQNVDELMENLDNSILALEDAPEDKETIEEIFRGAHTLKGAAGMFGYRAMERVMHRMENMFDLIRKGNMVPDAGIIDAVFAGLDVIRDLIEAVRDGKPCGRKTASIVYALELVTEGKSASHILGNKATAEDTPATDNQPAVVAAAASLTPSEDNDSKSGASKKAAKNEVSTIRVDLQRLDALVNLIGELVIDRTRFATIEEDLRQNHPQMDSAGQLSDTLQMFGRHMNEIQDIIMKVRMVPIGNAFNKFSRIIRDLGRTLGKDIDLIIDGETTELDKTLVEQIADPLVHLIRNACDHGVEMPEDRVKAGKNKKGKVFLSARQEGNHIIIAIEDDGKGMDVEVIRAKGIEKGLITEDEVLSNREVFSLIFEAGFSTAEAVTTVSGRGVGMDVVKKQISKLKGIVDIDSTPGKGSLITIQLPLTLAIVQSLLVTSNEDVFAIPLSTVVESIRIGPSEIQKVGDQEVIKLRDRVLPLMYLNNALGLSEKEEDFWYGEKSTNYAKTSRNRGIAERLFVVVVGSGDRRFGIVVDQLLNQQEMVIKPMGGVMKDIQCVAGGAVLGNGEVVLVLDIAELESKFKQKARQIAA